MLRTRKSVMESRKLDGADKITDRCQFCLDEVPQSIVDEAEHFYVTNNRVPYDYFEGIPVLDHLMVIPRRHIITIADMSDAEKIEYVTLLGKYESKDYAVFSRAVDSATRSVEHVHTHLLEIPGKRVAWQLYIGRPYLVLSGKQKKS